MIIGGSGWGKTKPLVNLINEQDATDKIYLYTNDLSEPKYKFMIKNAQKTCKWSKCIYWVFKYYGWRFFDNYNPNRKRKILISFDGLIADIMTNKKF